MNSINQKLMKKFTKLATQRLEGDWILIGGSLLPLLGSQNRVTNDIDFFSKTGADHKTTLQLFDLAEELGLPVEAINQAAAHFLFKQKKWKDHLVLVQKGKKGSLYRPDRTLYLLLKIGRLSTSDLQDCIEFLRLCQHEEILFDSQQINSAIKKELNKPPHSAKRTRLLKLQEHVLNL